MWEKECKRVNRVKRFEKNETERDEMRQGEAKYARKMWSKGS